MVTGPAQRITRSMGKMDEQLSVRDGCIITSFSSRVLSQKKSPFNSSLPTKN